MCVAGSNPKRIKESRRIAGFFVLYFIFRQIIPNQPTGGLMKAPSEIAVTTLDIVIRDIIHVLDEFGSRLVLTDTEGRVWTISGNWMDKHVYIQRGKIVRLLLNEKGKAIGLEPVW